MTDRIGLQHTRGVPLRNLCLLCAILRELGGDAPRRTLLLAGRDLGLPQLKSVERQGGLPTRVRHHEYALQELELIDIKGQLCSLTGKGARLARVTKSLDVEPLGRGAENADRGLSEPVRAELREVLCSSTYVRYWWLRYFMAEDEFVLADLVDRGADVIIELIPPDERAARRGPDQDVSQDSGYRLHSYLPLRESLPLDETGRREIHEGLRQWCMRMELVDEVSGWDRVFEIEDQYRDRIESQSSRLARAYVVRNSIDLDADIAPFEDMVAALRQRLGSPNRIRVPVLVIHLALEERLSLPRIRELLRKLHSQGHAQYFFEPASRSLLAQPENPFGLESYVKIAGTWRSSIVFSH